LIDTRLTRDTLASEWTKLRTVRSTYWSVLLAVVLGIGIGCLFAWGGASHYSTASLADKATFDPTALSTAGGFFAQLALGVMAILAVSSEYSTGTIRTTCAAVPQRGYSLAAKAGLVGVICLILGLGIAFGAFFLCHAIFAHYHLAVGLSSPGVARAVVGAGLYICVLGLFSIGIASIIRHTAGAITVLVAFVFIIPIMSGLLPDSWQENFSRYLPSNAGGAITSVVQQSNSLRPWPGFFVFLAWALGSLAVGWYLLRTRDV
jgi:ABC-2 type transport system permease protein